eukprot:11886073-Heterocapsa_arctica.AAC.1
MSDLHKFEIAKIRMLVERSAFPPEMIYPRILFTTKQAVHVTVIFSFVRSSGRPYAISKDGV